MVSGLPCCALIRVGGLSTCCALIRVGGLSIVVCRYNVGAPSSSGNSSDVVKTRLHWHAHAVEDLCFSTDGKISFSVEPVIRT